MRVSQQGSGALVLVSMLIALSSVALVTLSQFSGGQRSFNRGYKQDSSGYWHLFGSAECVLAEFIERYRKTWDVSSCQYSNVTISSDIGMQPVVTVTFGSQHISQQFYLPKPIESAALKASSDLYFHQPVAIDPDMRAKSGDGRWQCKSIRYSGALNAPYITTKHPYQTQLPLWSQFERAGERCDEGYHSSSGVTGLKADIVKVASYDMLDDYFDGDREHWFASFSSDHFARIPASLDNASGHLMAIDESALPIAQYSPDCGRDIEQSIDKQHQAIWVFGDCELDGSDIVSINQTIKRRFEENGVIIVVQGRIAVVGDGMLLATLIQFSPDPTGSEFNWLPSSHLSAVQSKLSELGFEPMTATGKVSYFQSGHFSALGGLVLDSPESLAIFTQQQHFAFVADLGAQALKPFRPIVIPRGRRFVE